MDGACTFLVPKCAYIHTPSHNACIYILSLHVCPCMPTLPLFVDEKGCSYCGGLGHRITECPKLEATQMKETGRIGKKDYLAESAADW